MRWCVAAFFVLGVGVTVPAEADVLRAGFIVTESDSLEGRLLDPSVCPWNPDLISFQVKRSRDRLVVFDQVSGRLDDVRSATTTAAMPFGDSAGTYDGELDWMRAADDRGRAWFAFSGAGDVNNRDIYLSYLGADRVWRLTNNRAIDGVPRFSPDGASIVFQSTRSGEGDLFMIRGVDELRAAIDAGGEIRPEANVVRLTDNPRPDLHPSWHPAGRFVVFSQFARAEEELTTEPNYGLAIVDTENPRTAPTRLTFDRAQETRATWSPDGNRLAFYFSERVEATRVDVGVLEVVYEEGTDVPARARLIETGAGRVLADDVLPGERNGPVWIVDPTSPRRGHSLVYLQRRSADDVYEVVVSDVRRWEAGDAGHDRRLTSPYVAVVADPVWDFRGSIVCAGQTGLSFGLFRLIPDFDLTPGTDTRGESFARTAVAVNRGRSIFGPPYWEEAAAAVGVVGIVALILGSGGDDGTPPPSTPDIGSPPDPPVGP